MDAVVILKKTDVELNKNDYILVWEQTKGLEHSELIAKSKNKEEVINIAKIIFVPKGHYLSIIKIYKSTILDSVISVMGEIID